MVDADSHLKLLPTSILDKYKVILSLPDVSAQGVGGNGDTNWLPCALEMPESLIFHFYIALLYPQ